MPSRVHKDGRRDDEALREVLAVDAKNDVSSDHIGITTISRGQLQS